MLKSKRSELFEKIKNLAENTSVHGIPRAIRHRNIVLKIAWVIFILCSMGYCCYELTNIFGSYFRFLTNTRFYSVREASLEFPTVTFCNKKLYKAKEDEEAFRELVDGLEENFFGDNFDDETDPLEILDVYDYVAKYEMANLTLEEKIIIGYSLDEMLISCRFNNRKCSNYEFELYNTPALGNCYKFNSGKFFNGTSYQKKRISNPGRKNGLKLELYVGISNNRYEVSRSSGIYLFIHNSTSIFHVDKEGASIATGEETDVMINQMFYLRQSDPYSNCISNLGSPSSFDSKLYRKTVELLGIYTQKYCYKLCNQEFIIEKCGCYDVTVNPNFNYPKACGGEDHEIGCIRDAYEIFSSSKEALKCYDNCPPECITQDYSLELSHSSFPSHFYANLLKVYDEDKTNSSRNLSYYENFKQSVLSVNIFYNDISYMVIEEFPAFTISQLFASVGGIIAFCVGTSLLSFAEIFDFIFETFYIIIKKRKTIEPLPKQ